MTSGAAADSAEPEQSGRRRYDSPVRRARAAETRERIVAAGAELAHSLTRWDWRSITVRAVAERAGVSERTVYRNFETERELRDAIMRRLEQEAGDPLEGLHLDDLPATTAEVFSYLASFATAPREPSEPTFVEVDHRRRQALVAAVESAAVDWSAEDVRTAAALLDVLWSLPCYERLTATWGVSADDASDAITGVIAGLVEAIADGRRPWLPR